MHEDPEEEILDSYVSKSMDGQFMQDGDIRGKKVRERLFNEKPYRTMHVCMATDIDVDVIKDGPYAPQDHYTEHLLCTVRIYNDGLVEMDPKLSSAIEEKNGQPGQDSSNALFMSDESVSVASRSGLRL